MGGELFDICYDGKGIGSFGEDGIPKLQGAANFITGASSAYSNETQQFLIFNEVETVWSYTPNSGDGKIGHITIDSSKVIHPKNEVTPASISALVCISY